MATNGVPLPDNERFILEDDDGESTWVVLAAEEIDGTEYVLLAPEAQLADEADDMDVMVFRYGRDEDGSRSIEGIEDEALAERVYDTFASTMGLEPSQEN